MSGPKMVVKNTFGPVGGTHEERVEQVMKETFVTPVKPPPPPRRKVSRTNPHWYRDAKFYEVDEIPHLNSLGRTDRKTALNFVKHGELETLKMPSDALKAPQWGATEHDYKPFSRNSKVKPVNAQSIFTGQGFYPALSRPHMFDDEARIAAKRLKESHYLRGLYYHVDDLARMKAATKKGVKPSQGILGRMGSVFTGARTDRYGFLLPMDTNIWDEEHGFARKDTHVMRMEFDREHAGGGMTRWEEEELLEGRTPSEDEAQMDEFMTKHNLQPHTSNSPPKVVARNIQPTTSFEYANGR